MKFQFTVNLTDEDYLDYNLFWQFKSPYGKKQVIELRILLAIIVGLLAFVALLEGDFTQEAFLDCIPYAIALVLLEIFFKRIFLWIFKGYIKSLNKKGKKGYSPFSTMEFYDDVFVEVTPENKTEAKYSAIERVSIVDCKVIYLHANNLLAYILPLSSFETRAQYDDFIQFIKTKCLIVDEYTMSAMK